VNSIPSDIGGAQVLYYTKIDERHHVTGKCHHAVGRQVMGAAAGLAICQYPGEDSYYLFYCDRQWNVVTDTWHETIKDALQQAEFEYEGVSATWRRAAEPVNERFNALEDRV
jgi:hypothetical protein